MRAGYMPFSGKRFKLSNTEDRVLNAALSAPSTAGYSRGVSRPALMAELAADTAQAPTAKHLFTKSLFSLEEKVKSYIYFRKIYFQDML